MNKFFRRAVLFLVSLIFIVAGVFCLVLYSNSLNPAGSSPVIEAPDAWPPDEPPEKPEGSSELVMLNRYKDYYEENEDLVGWIRVPNTAIDYPVVYCSDNYFYLHNDFLKKPSKEGVPFLDMGAGILENNRSLSIYGHYLKNGKMFTALHKYKNLDYYRSYPLFQFDTLYEEGLFKIFSVFYMAGNRSDKLFYYYPVADFPDDEAFMRHVKQLQVRSIFDTTVDVDPGDQLVLLTCCTYEVDNLRLIVAGRKVRPGESLSIDTEGASLNPQPLYPQKWYNSKGGSPPEGSY